MSLERGGVRESLIFRNPEQAGAFKESVERRIQQEAIPGASAKKEAVAEELVRVFETEGVGVTPIREPWEHTPREHQETQKLVDIAFSHDLAAAIAAARTSEFFPRNLDLLHDVLTNRLYDAVVMEKVNTSHAPAWTMILFLGLFIGIITAVIAFVYSL